MLQDRVKKNHALSSHDDENGTVEVRLSQQDSRNLTRVACSIAGQIVE